jgi:hypothetical protein
VLSPGSVEIHGPVIKIFRAAILNECELVMDVRRV